MDYERVEEAQKRLADSMPTTQELARGFACAAQTMAKQMPTMGSLAKDFAGAAEAFRECNKAAKKFAKQ